MPCAGCKDKVRIEGLFKMRFVGRPNGKLMKGAKANYVHGQIYDVPAHYGERPCWEPVESLPELKVPEVTKVDSVYDDAVYVPQEDDNPSFVSDTNTEWEHHIKEVMTKDAKQGLYHIDVEEGITPIVPEVEKSTMTRDELKAALDVAGIKYSPHSRTETLAKMVKDLNTE